MTKQEAIWAMEEGKKVSHRYFTDDEYIFQKDLHIFSEDGVRHDQFWELHADAAYETDWEIFKQFITKHRAISAMMKGKKVRHGSFLKGEILCMHGDFRVYTSSGEYIPQDNFPESGWEEISEGPNF